MKEIFVGIQPGPGLPTVVPVNGRLLSASANRKVRGQHTFIDRNKGAPYGPYRRYNSYEILRLKNNYGPPGNSFVQK